MANWTRFMDMHSGGGCKQPPYEKILIEAPEQEAKVIFYNRFGHNPERVTCTCCGEDYSISESEDLAQATAYDRNCSYAYFDAAGNEVERAEADYRDHLTLEEYLARPEVLIIRAHEIKSEERIGDVPQQGYVWQA